MYLKSNKKAIMDITGKIVRVFDPVGGTSKAGREWKKREYLLEIPNDNFAPRQVFFHFFGDKADQYILEGGKDYKVSIDINSREFNGRWYTDIQAWKAEPVEGGASTSGTTVPPPPTDKFNDPFETPGPANDFVMEDSDAVNDDLPF